MPESLDFDQLLRELRAEAATRDVMAMKEPDAIDRSGHEHVARLLREAAEQLRQVWNARGAADRETITASLEYLLILAKAKEPPDVLAQIRALDR